MSLSDNADPKVASSTPHARPAAPAPQQGRARRRKALTWILATLAVVVTVAAAGGLVWQIAAVASPRTGTFTPPEAYPPAEPAPVLAASDAEAPVPDLASIMPGLLADPRLDGSTSASFADALTGDTWVASTRFPTLPYLAGVAAATMVGKPWLSRSWRRVRGARWDRRRSTDPRS